jgi:type IV secretion system protein VirD4
VTSTKSDLYELTALARQRKGPVFALDPDGLAPAAPAARWSPVSGCELSEVAERRAAALVAATGGEGDVQNGAFFRDSARDLLKAYLHAAALEGLDIRAVLEWSRRPEDTAPADVLFSSPFAAPGWADLVGLHTTGAAETTSGVLRYVGRALSCFSHEAVVQMCCPAPGEELEIEDLLLGQGTVYLLGKGSRLGAVAPLITAFADEVFDCAERLAVRMPGRRLDPPLLGLLDEAPSIVPLPGLPELLADGRGRGIVVVYAMQSFSQAVSRWGPQKAETMGNATAITAVLGGLTSPTDLSDLEKLCGQRRARRESNHHGTSSVPGRARDHSRTVSWESEPVLRADQIRTLPAGTALVLWSRLPPVLVRLPLLSERPEWPLVRQEEALTREANDRARSPERELCAEPAHAEPAHAEPAHAEPAHAGSPVGFPTDVSVSSRTGYRVDFPTDVSVNSPASISAGSPSHISPVS